MCFQDVLLYLMIFIYGLNVLIANSKALFVYRFSECRVLLSSMVNFITQIGHSLAAIPAG